MTKNNIAKDICYNTYWRNMWNSIQQRSFKYHFQNQFLQKIPKYLKKIQMTRVDLHRPKTIIIQFYK